MHIWKEKHPRSAKIRDAIGTAADIARAPIEPIVFQFTTLGSLRSKFAPRVQYGFHCCEGFVRSESTGSALSHTYKFSWQPAEHPPGWIIKCLPSKAPQNVSEIFLKSCELWIFSQNVFNGIAILRLTHTCDSCSCVCLGVVASLRKSENLAETHWKSAELSLIHLPELKFVGISVVEAES